MEFTGSRSQWCKALASRTCPPKPLAKVGDTVCSGRLPALRAKRFGEVSL
jgi:hypothetical protein